MIKVGKQKGKVGIKRHIEICGIFTCSAFNFAQKSGAKMCNILIVKATFVEF